MRVVNTNAVSYQSKTPEKCMETAWREKKRKYLNYFLNERRHFTPFVNLVGEIMGVEAEKTLKCITSHLTQKWQEPYSRTCWYVKSRVAITLVQATHRCIRGSRVLTSRIIMTRPKWEYGTGFHIFR